jgi:pyridinium-3,5-bisthiocarboxylic acid mononucleotide nickel chelatase
MRRSRLLYLDCFSGISGDMTLGAFLDAGLPLAELERALGSLAVSDYEVRAEKVLRAGVSATKFTLHEHAASGDGHSHAHGASHTAPSTQHPAPSTSGIAPSTSHPAPSTRTSHLAPRTPHQHPHRSLPEIFTLIDGSALSRAGRDRAKALFQRLAEAEAAIHQMPVEKVHLHEVGALDSIIDIVGTVFAMEWAGVERIVCSPLNVGGGMVRSAHGVFPVPAPATVRLLGQTPIYSGNVQKELVTPTGALIATSYATAFGPVPSMTIDRVGYGAGARDDAETPNVLRILMGEEASRQTGDRVAVVECEIDDMNPQLFGSTMEQLYAAGALEVFYVPVQMKKNRPGTLLTVICRPEHRPALSDIVFRETTTIGLRHAEVERECLTRDVVTVETPLGPVRVKRAWRGGRIVNAAPEFEDCAAIARNTAHSVKEVQAIALRAYGRQTDQESTRS